MTAQFTLEYWTDDGWYIGRLREAPGVFSQGETLEELEANIRDAYALVKSDEQARCEPGTLTLLAGELSDHLDLP